MTDFLERCIRYVSEMAGEGFDDAEALMTEAFKKAGIKPDDPDALGKLLEVLFI